MFDHMIDCIAKHKPERSGAFFHYCRMPILEQFLKDNAEIYCTHAMHLNDNQEIFCGFEEYLLFLKNRKAFSDTCLNMLRDNLKDNINKFDPKDATTPCVMPWVFSLSEGEDSPYQWRHYADSQFGGYCIAFRSELLEDAIKALNNANAGVPNELRQILILFPCLYIGKDDSVIEELFEATYMDREEDFEKIKISMPGNEAPRQSGVNVLSTILMVSALIKRSCFQHEREWRVIMHATGRIKEHFEIVGDKPRLKTYLSAGINGRVSDMIGQVCRSPQGFTKKLTRHANRLLQKYNLLLPVHASRVSRSVVENYITQAVVSPEYENEVVVITTIDPAGIVRPSNAI